MLHLLSLEWKKYKKNRLFWITTIAYLIFLPAILYIGKTLDIGEGNPIIPSNDIFFQFPGHWKFLGYIGSWLAFFVLGFMGLYFISHEYGNKTFRQNIITGMTRKTFYLAKLQWIVLLCVLATAYYWLCGFTIGFLETPSGTYTSYYEDNYTILRYFVMCLGYTSLAFLLGMVIRKSGIALIVYFSYVMVIELIIRWLGHFQLIKNKSMHFYPMNAAEDLMPIPFSEVAGEFIQENKFSYFLTFEEAIITSLIYSIIFLTLAWVYLKRADL